MGWSDSGESSTISQLSPYDSDFIYWKWRRKVDEELKKYQYVKDIDVKDAISLIFSNLK